jgi:hypothetical protein
VTAVDIYQWAKENWPGPTEPPARIETKYEVFPNRMLYKHPTGWSDVPPPGYDKYGNKMW